MKTFALAMATLALVLAPPQAWAQRQGRGFGGGLGGFNPLNLLSQDSVQKELKLSDEQIKQVNEQTDKQRAGAGELRNLSREERQSKMADRAKASRTAIATILNKDQAGRFTQISLQQRGGAALADPEIAESLALTSEQKDRVKAIQDASQTEMRELFQGGGDDRDAMRKKIEAARKSTDEKTLGVLTPEQQKKWKDMAGEPFKGEIVPRQIRRGNRGAATGRPTPDRSARAASQGPFRLTSFLQNAENPPDARQRVADLEDRPARARRDRGDAPGRDRRPPRDFRTRSNHGPNDVIWDRVAAAIDAPRRGDGRRPGPDPRDREMRDGRGAYRGQPFGPPGRDFARRRGPYGPGFVHRGIHAGHGRQFAGRGPYGPRHGFASWRGHRYPAPGQFRQFAGRPGSDWRRRADFASRPAQRYSYGGFHGGNYGYAHDAFAYRGHHRHGHHRRGPHRFGPSFAGRGGWHGHDRFDARSASSTHDLAGRRDPRDRGHHHFASWNRHRGMGPGHHPYGPDRDRPSAGPPFPRRDDR